MNSPRRATPLLEQNDRRTRLAFTLIELLVVISIIAVLMGIAFPVFQSVQNSAKRTQAKNDLVQIVTAVNAFYTEYGKYPLPPSAAGDVTYGDSTANRDLLRVLMGKDTAQNPRAIAFLSPPIAKQTDGYGVSLDDQGVPTSDFNHPWSKTGGKVQYRIRIDGDYDGQVHDPDNEQRLLPQGVLSWSPGKDANAPKIYSYK